MHSDQSFVSRSVNFLSDMFGGNGGPHRDRTMNSILPRKVTAGRGRAPVRRPFYAILQRGGSPERTRWPAPGSTVTLHSGAQYTVAPDGSFRAVKAAA